MKAATISEFLKRPDVKRLRQEEAKKELKFESDSEEVVQKVEAKEPVLV